MSASLQPEMAPPAKSGSGLKVVLIVLAVIFILGIVACAGMVGIGYFAFQEAQKQAGVEIMAQFRGNPVLEAEIGELQSAKVMIMETAERAQQTPGGAPQMVIDVVGSKGSGKMICVPAEGGNNKMASATLELPDGRSIEIPVDGGSADFDPTSDLDLGELDLGDGGVPEGNP